MGCDSSKENRINKIKNEITNSSNIYDPKVLNKLFNNYIFQDKYLDLIEKNKLNDPVFKSIHEEEKQILEKFYKENKNNFKIKMDEYLNRQNLNFVNMLTKEIISNEDGRKIINGNIKSEIEKIYNDDKLFKINYLSIIIIGKAGAGKSTLVNSLLYGDKKEAKERAGPIATLNNIPQRYYSKNVPYLQLIDTRGIELAKLFSVKSVGITITDYINEQLKQNNINNFVHCIWYCIDSTRFEEDEQVLVNNVTKLVSSSQIPIIIVLTQAVNIPVMNEMKKYIKSINEDFEVIDIIARDIPTKGQIIPSYGLDNLVESTIKKVRKGFDGFMRKVMMKDLTKYIKTQLFKENSKNKLKINRMMKLETIENDLANQNFDEYINDIYSYNVGYFLQKSKLNSNSDSLIKKSEFNKHKTHFFEDNHQYLNQLISKEIQKFSYIFLDIQAKKEIEKRSPTLIANKRNYKDFCNTTRKFLMDNFDYFSKKYYIYYIIENISLRLSTNFEQELNQIVNNLMESYEIQEIIKNCFYKKFSDFERKAKSYPPFSLRDNIYYNIPNVSDNKNWFDFSEIHSNRKDNNPFEAENSEIPSNSKDNNLFEEEETNFLSKL